MPDHTRGAGPPRRPGQAAAAALLVCGVCGLFVSGFALDRPRHFDLGRLGWSAAFSRLCALLPREYPFTAWKGLDFAALERRLGPRVAAAEARGDRRAWYRALRELVWEMRDGHARLAGDDGGLRRAEIGGTFGFEVVELDGGRLLAAEVAPDGPAARAGMRPGAELVRWNGAPAGEALAAVPVLWSERPPATREGRRLVQARLLARAPVGAVAAVAFRNRPAPATTAAAAPAGAMVAASAATAAASPSNAAAVATAALTAVAAPPERPPCLRAAELLTGRTFIARELPEGAGYVRIRFELPALRTPLPGWSLARAISRFRADRLPGVVVDVRGNCGGLDAMVPPLVAPLLPEALFYEMPGVLQPAGRFAADPRQSVAVVPRPRRFRGRIAVLVDGGTISAGEAIPLLLAGLPGVAVIGFHATHGSFGIGLKSVRMPGGLEVIFPHAQSLDLAGRIEVDGDAAGRGGVEPDLRLPLDDAAFERVYLRGEDVALAAAVRFVRGGAPAAGAAAILPGDRP